MVLAVARAPKTSATYYIQIKLQKNEQNSLRLSNSDKPADHATRDGTRSLLFGETLFTDNTAHAHRTIDHRGVGRTEKKFDFRFDI